MNNETAFTVHTASWDTDADAIMQIRYTVFVQEQKVPKELESDEYDHQSVYVIAKATTGDTIGCARLQPNGKITRMAVLKPWRRRGVAAAMLKEILQLAQEQPVPALYLHAQLSAIALYEQFGFKQMGEQFEEAGIVHIKMQRIPSNEQS